MQCATGCMHAPHDTVYSSPVLMYHAHAITTAEDLHVLPLSLCALLTTLPIYCYNSLY
jgi:hypothetical protein